MRKCTQRDRRVGLLLAALLVASSAGCRLGRRHSPDDAQVRLINAASDTDELTVAVDGRVWKHSPYRNNSGYQDVPHGEYDVRLSPGGRGELRPVLRPMAFQQGHTYTVLALSPQRGSGRQTAVRVFEDESTEDIPSNQARVRFINAAPGIGRVDVLFNNIVGLERVGFGRRSAPILLDDGSYDIKVHESGGYAAPLIGPVSLRLEGGHAYTLVAMGRNARSLTLEAYPDNP